MIGFHVSLHPLPPGHELAADVELLSSRRRALAAARALDVANAYLCRAKRARRGRPAEVLQVEEVRFHAPQVLLFPVACRVCGATFQPLRAGRPPRKCPACREAARRAFFADRARARRTGGCR